MSTFLCILTAGGLVILGTGAFLSGVWLAVWLADKLDQ